MWFLLTKHGMCLQVEKALQASSTQQAFAYQRSNHSLEWVRRSPVHLWCTVLKQKSSAETAPHPFWNSVLQSRREEGWSTSHCMHQALSGQQEPSISLWAEAGARIPPPAAPSCTLSPDFTWALCKAGRVPKHPPLLGLPRYFYFQKGGMIYFQFSYCMWDFSFSLLLAQTFPSQTSVPITAEAPGKGASWEGCEHLSFA